MSILLRLRILGHFLRDAGRAATTGSLRYWCWLAFLLTIMAGGVSAYTWQFRHGLAVTGLNDHVSWGFYISNFTFLVGLAAAAVMLVLPAYVLKDVDFSGAVLIGEGVAVSALIMCLLFVVADMGGPTRLWHMIPGIGYFNWPSSMLTWDVVVLNGYLALNLLIPLYILLNRYCNRRPNKKLYVPFIFLSVAWAFGIHLVTAFLYAGLPARPFWNTSLLGPRFLASAFAAGPAFIIVTLTIIRRYMRHDIREVTIAKLALIMTVAAQINLVMLISELFKEFYHPTEHGLSAIYLFFGLHGHAALVPWIWSSVILNVLATLLLSIHPIRKSARIRIVLCVTLFVCIWIEKGLGLIIPGFIPSPLGEIVEYAPSHTELWVCAGIWATGFFVLTMLVRVAIPIEKGEVRWQGDERRARGRRRTLRSRFS